MATESFAQARITGEPGRKFQLRGGGVPTSDIPNLPKADLSMPTANYPSIPTIRHQEMSLGGQDWGRRAGQLQQKELPSSFEHGAKRIAAAAGEGEYKMGQAISKGSASLAGGMADLGRGLTRLQENLSHETLKSVGAKEDNAYRIARSNFDVRAAKEGIAPSDYHKEFWNNEGKNYLNEVETLKPQGGFGNVGVKDDLDAKVAGREAGFMVYSNEKVAEQIHNSNVTAHKFSYDNALAENRFDDARGAVSKARAANTINDGEVERMNGEIKTAEDKWYSNAVITGPRPDVARDEADKILKARPGEEGKASELFPRMDKVEARRIKDEAEKVIANNEKTAGDRLLQRAREGNATEDQIRETAKKEGIDAKTTDSIVKSTSEGRPYDEGKAATAMAVVKALDFRDPKTALKELRDVKQLILDTTDKGTQDVLLKEVSDKWEKRDKPTTVQAEEVKSTSRMIESWFPTPEEMKKLPEAERNKLDKDRMELHMEMARFTEANPEFDSNKLREHIVEKHTPKLQENSQKAVNRESNVVVDTRRPYLGASGTPIVPTGPVEGSPEWIAAKKEAAMKPKGAAPEAGYKQVAGGYIVPGEPGENVTPEAALGTQTPAPTPYTSRVAPPVPLASAFPQGKAIGGIPEVKAALPAEQGYSPTPTPYTPRVAPAAAPATAAQPGQKITIQATAYVPGMGGKEGKNEVAFRSGPAYTMEQYERGEVPWVSVAADSESSLQGKFLKNDAYPGVVFKVEDTGSAFKGAGDTRIDIAFADKSKAKSFAAAGNDYEVLDEAGAAQVAGGPRGTAPSVTARGAETSTGPIKIATRAGELDLPAMKRPRDTSKVSKIVVHGDVLTDVDKLIDIQRNDDRGYHYYIALDGSITEAVDPGHIANHIKGANSDSIGIILVGADNGKMPTAAQDAAAKKLISQLAKKYGISNKDVYGHGERQPDRRDPREGGNVARDVREKGFA